METNEKAVRKRVLRRLRNIGMKHEQRLREWELGKRFINHKFLGLVDDSEYGSKPQRMSLKQAIENINAGGMDNVRN